jgi:hypothetical protein
MEPFVEKGWEKRQEPFAIGFRVNVHTVTIDGRHVRLKGKNSPPSTILALVSTRHSGSIDFLVLTFIEALVCFVA